MRILICGDRNWTDRDMIKKMLATMSDVECVIEGEARGADTLARLAAEELNIPVVKYPAEWGIYGRAAGPIRNSTMLADGKPDLVLAFHDDIESSKGTKNMLLQARKAGVACILYKHE